MSEEIFDVCDEHDNVIGTAPRSVVHARGLLHRAVHIWVFNTVGELMIHLRSTTKDEYPSCYTSAASGHLGAGEDYESAAHRELAEELGLSGELKYAAKLPASPATANEHTVLYTLSSEAIPTPDPAEIARVEYHPVAVIAEMVKTRPEMFTPPFKSLLAWWVCSRSV